MKLASYPGLEVKHSIARGVLRAEVLWLHGAVAAAVALCLLEILLLHCVVAVLQCLLGTFPCHCKKRNNVYQSHNESVFIMR